MFYLSIYHTITQSAVVHLCRLFLPHLRASGQGAIINVTSGLSFVPKVCFVCLCVIWRACLC